MYANAFKRVIDLFLSFVALLVLSPIILILTIVGAIKMKGNPFFTQQRPGKDERIFKLIKFRTMTNAKDKNGKLLPDDERLTKYGRFLRATSLDELPELINIFVGDMAVVGPRPQLVRDMVFMSEEERTRHSVRPGLTGLAQINGRNTVTWEKKFVYDLEYIQNITLWNDIKIIFKTVMKVTKCDGISAAGMATAEDFGDYLLREGKVDQETYDKRQKEAKELMEA